MVLTVRSLWNGFKIKKIFKMGQKLENTSKVLKQTMTVPAGEKSQLGNAQGQKRKIFKVSLNLKGGTSVQKSFKKKQKKTKKKTDQGNKKNHTRRKKLRLAQRMGRSHLPKVKESLSKERTC